MKLLGVLLCAAASFWVASAGAVPRGAVIQSPKKSGRADKDKWGHCKEDWRRTVKIRSSKDDSDDVSADFLWGIKQANRGGTLHLEAGKKYVLGKKLDLSFLNDIYVKLDGELKVNFLCCNFGRANRKIVHQQYYLLAEQQFLLSFPEVNHILGVGRKGHQDIRQRHLERQWPGMVQWICWPRDLSW
jgi:hypothetical protein